MRQVNQEIKLQGLEHQRLAPQQSLRAAGRAGARGGREPLRRDVALLGLGRDVDRREHCVLWIVLEGRVAGVEPAEEEQRGGGDFPRGAEARGERRGALRVKVQQGLFVLSGRRFRGC